MRYCHKKKNLRTTRQVSIYCMFREGNRNFYVLARRSPERGGFWQPFTGGEEDYDGGNLIHSVIREIHEEFGIKINKNDVVNIGYTFSYRDTSGIERSETCFGVIIKPRAKQQMRLSLEHTSVVYSDDIDYLKSLLKFEENRTGLEEFYKLTKNWEKTINRKYESPKSNRELR